MELNDLVFNGLLSFFSSLAHKRTAREAAMWELEERHLQEKHQLLKQQLKDQYFMQRHQLLKRHDKVRPDRQFIQQIKNWYDLLPL